MKKILSLLLLFALLCCAVSCKDKTSYEPVQSTEEEARTVLTLPKKNGGTYEVAYELYRALFLSLREEIDGGDHSVFSGENAAEYVKAADELVFRRIADIYAALSLAKELGYEPYGSDADESVAAAIETSVNGGDGVVGFEGDYQAYLQSLKEMYLNYSVQDLLYRYSFAYNYLLDYYTDTSELSEEEKTQKAAEAKAYYDGEDSVLVWLATLGADSFTAERAKQIRDSIASKTSDEAVKNYIIGFTATTPEDVTTGLLIGRESLDDAYFGEVTETAFALEEGETGEPVYVAENGLEYYYILYRIGKTEDYYDANADYVLESYLENRMGTALAEERDRLLAGLVESEYLQNLNRSEIAAP